jgi:hypothetical protein
MNGSNPAPPASFWARHVQNYTQVTHISQVKNTKTKRMTKSITRNAIIMICPFKLAFFMTIATLFCVQTKKGIVLDCWNEHRSMETRWSIFSYFTIPSGHYLGINAISFHEMHAELFRNLEEGMKKAPDKMYWDGRWSKRYKAHLHKVKPIWSSFHIKAQLTQKLLLNNVKQT